MIRIQSWNIAQDLDKPKEYIKNWNSDIYFLLECGTEEDLKKIVENKFYRFCDHTYNMAAISKYEFLSYQEIRHEDVTKPILYCQFKINNHLLNFFIIHLIMPINDQEKLDKQIKEVEVILQKIKDITNGENTIAMGDFNSRSPLDNETEYLNVSQSFHEAGFVDSATLIDNYQFSPTKIDRSNLNKRVDFCMLSKDLSSFVSDYGVQDTDKSISDHRAIWVDLTIDE
ncbi:MAG: hypothetical protein COA79_15260 [Planctomycetota bacterium]|nr:MAG: hypothetical protein COA79_15260 [Planctomycetota bacterium]